MALFNVGHDLSIQFTLGGQVILDVGLHTSTKFSPEFNSIKVKPTNLNGVAVVRPTFSGHTVVLDFARVNGVADNIDQILEDTYKAQGTTPIVTMLRTTRNADGTVDQYRYINGTMWPTSEGDYKADAEVPCSYTFFFQERQLVSSNSGTTISSVGG